jgi:hypothetical protein
MVATADVIDSLQKSRSFEVSSALILSQISYSAVLSFSAVAFMDDRASLQSIGGLILAQVEGDVSIFSSIVLYCCSTIVPKAANDGTIVVPAELGKIRIGLSVLAGVENENLSATTEEIWLFQYCR